MALTREAVAASRPNRPVAAMPAAAGGFAFPAIPSRCEGAGQTRTGRGAGRSAFPLLGLLIALALSIPVFTVRRSVLLPPDATCAGLVGLTLPRYLLNTAGLLVGVGLG